MNAKSKRVLALLNDPRYRNRLIGDINPVDQDEPARVNRDQEMRVLKEMDELEEFQNENGSHGAV